jgi:kynurenine formamidase
MISSNGVPASRALTRVGAAEVQGSAALVRSGRVYDLGLDLNATVPQGVAGAFMPFSFDWMHLPDPCAGAEEFQFAAEGIAGTPHIGTHIDGLMHITSGVRTFGGFDVREVVTDDGFAHDGMETVPPIVTRALILDVAARRGDPLPDSYEITSSDLDDVLRDRHLDIRKGDAVLVRTGKVREYGIDNEAYQAAQPGVGADAAIWLYEQGMAVLGTDTTGTEPQPFPDSTRTTHQAMLVERGVHLVENLNLEEIAADGICEAMFICLPLRLTGATGSWVRPVAIV